MSEEYIIDIIKAIADKRGTLPRLVPMTEIKQQVVDDALNVLRKLYKEKKVFFHNQLNDFAFCIVGEDETSNK